MLRSGDPGFSRILSFILYPKADSEAVLTIGRPPEVLWRADLETPLRASTERERGRIGLNEGVMDDR